MNKTQKLIILVGNEQVLRIALDTIKGFNAVTCVKHLNEDIIKNVFNHNKNVLHAMTVYDLSLSKYNPIIINVVKKGTDCVSMRLGLENIINDFPMLLDSKDIDVGDHIKYDSKNICHSTENCMLCRIVEGRPLRKEYILYETKNFFCVPGLGAFFDGYVMIVPKKHVMSFAELNEEKVQYIHTNGFEEKIQNIENRINYLKSKGYKNIAIITKDYEEGNKINERLTKKNIDVELISEELKKFSGGITIVPSFLSKGLEFDSVIISDYKSYDESILDTKLLYVAFTRAMHTLDVYI